MTEQNVVKNSEFADSFLAQTEKKVNLAFTPTVVMPGEDVTDRVISGNKSIKIGPGLAHLDSRVHVTAPGVLKYRAPSNYWVESNHKRYYPNADDQVVGIIDQVAGDFYTVNIFSGSNAILNRQAFEGATKRNKPELKRGDILYARVLKTHKDMDIELSCIATSGSKKEWSTGETVNCAFLFAQATIFIFAVLFSGLWRVTTWIAAAFDRQQGQRAAAARLCGSEFSWRVGGAPSIILSPKVIQTRLLDILPLKQLLE